MERCSFDQLCDKLSEIGSETIRPLFRAEDREAFDPASFAKEELSDEFLGSLPFGKYLIDSANTNPGRDPKKKDDARVHMLYVIAGVVDALSGNQAKFLGSSPEFNTFHARLMADAAQERFNQTTLRKVCIIAALYHDLGKAIAGERHPYEGYHIIKDLGQVEMVSSRFAKTDSSDETSASKDLGQVQMVSSNSAKTDSSEETSASKDFRKWFEEAIKNEEEANYYYRFFMKLMRYHDMWGNITTGEASMVMLSSAIDLNDRSSGAIVFLGHLILLNLADQFGTQTLFDENDKKPTRLDNEMIKSLLARWDIVRDTLVETRGDPEATREALLKSAGQANETVERLYALLKASKIKIKEQRDVNDILKAVCGGRYYAFCEDFGVVRLSYALRFFKELSEKAEEQNNKLSINRQFTPYRQASLVITVLKRILDTYEALIRANKQQKRETGIEMSWLARSDAVRDSIILTLLGQERDEALSWIDDEVSAFPCG